MGMLATVGGVCQRTEQRARIGTAPRTHTPRGAVPIRAHVRAVYTERENRARGAHNCPYSLEGTASYGGGLPVIQLTSL